MEKVILVGADDSAVGTASRHQVHREGLLHRAVSVFVVNQQGKLLLQKRAQTKSTFAGLWANTCCSHPRPGETVEAAGARRLWEEMGLVVDLLWLGWFIYQAKDESSGHVEHELDHVLVGWSDENPTVNPEEADRHSWVDLGYLRAQASHPRYVPWLGPALEAFPEIGRTRRLG
jgi:isopentenyl-diphosphate delta-isomerase